MLVAHGPRPAQPRSIKEKAPPSCMSRQCGLKDISTKCSTDKCALIEDWRYAWAYSRRLEAEKMAPASVGKVFHKPSRLCIGRPEEGLVVIGLSLDVVNRCAHGPRSYSNTALRSVCRCRCIGTSDKRVRDRNRKQYTTHFDQDEKTCYGFDLDIRPASTRWWEPWFPPLQHGSNKIKPPQRLAPKSVSTRQSYTAPPTTHGTQHD
jgi:hypothetical protein